MPQVTVRATADVPFIHKGQKTLPVKKQLEIEGLYTAIETSMVYCQIFSAHIGTNLQKYWSVASARVACIPILKNN